MDLIPSQKMGYEGYEGFLAATVVNAKYRLDFHCFHSLSFNVINVSHMMKSPGIQGSSLLG